MLELRQLATARGAQRFVYDLTVADGELVAVMGESGVGKTTLLETIAGFYPATGGTLDWDGASLLGFEPEQ